MWKFTWIEDTLHRCPKEDQSRKREGYDPREPSESDIPSHQTLGHTGRRNTLFSNAEVELLNESTVWFHGERFESLCALWLSLQVNDDAVRLEFEQAGPAEIRRVQNPSG
jgi:hypothetical protein